MSRHKNNNNEIKQKKKCIKYTELDDLVDHHHHHRHRNGTSLTFLIVSICMMYYGPPQTSVSLEMESGEGEGEMEMLNTQYSARRDSMLCRTIASIS